MSCSYRYGLHRIIQHNDSMDEERDLLLVSIFTTLTIFLWVFFELVKTTKTSTISSPVQQVVSPLSSKIDISVLDELESRKTME